MDKKEGRGWLDRETDEGKVCRWSRGRQKRRIKERWARENEGGN